MLSFLETPRLLGRKMDGRTSQGDVGQEEGLLLLEALFVVGLVKFIRLRSILLRRCGGEGLLSLELRVTPAGGFGAKCMLLTALDFETIRGSGEVFLSSDMVGTSKPSSSQTREAFGGNPGD
jgi:hypothetical protein